MKRLIPILIALVLLPNTAQAKNYIKDLTFRSSDNVERDCLNKEAMGCIHYATKVVYINDKVDSVGKKFVIAHEMCHGIIDNEPMIGDEEEYTCDMFSLWIGVPSVFDQNKTEYFTRLLISS